MPNQTILDTALELHAAGYSVIPIRPDGTKAPAIAWKQYTQQRPTLEQLHTWFTDNQHDIAVIQGHISRNAELTELEGRAAAALPELRDLAHNSGIGELWDRITLGWTETSPSGGYHFHYRITGDSVPGNQKIARNTAREVLAETRGENGYVIIAPSKHHDTGKPWQRLIGSPANAATITAEEREDFHAILATLNEEPETPQPSTVPVAPHDPTQGITPGDDFENRTDWAQILTPHGWTLAFHRGNTRYWTRPGKTHGISATTGNANDRDRLYVFTSSTDFQPETPYTKLGAYAVLEHSGNHEAAAKNLYKQGFGQRAQQPRTITPNEPDFLADILRSTPSAPTASAQTAGTTQNTTSAGATTVEPGASQGTATATPAHTSAEITEPNTYSETDDGNALRLIDTYHHTIRYCPQRATWLYWNGHKWAWDESGHVQELSRTIARTLPNHDKEAQRHRKNSLSRRGIEAMTALARTDQRTSIHLANLDARPYELNTPGGVINLKTGTLNPPNPQSLHTRSTTVTPQADKPHPLWDRFLADTFAGDPDLTIYIQRLLGVSLVGVVLEQLLPFAHGAGANGKTTLAGVIQRIVGVGDQGYSISAPAEMLLATQQQGHPTEIARLSGARLVITSELEDGQRFAEAKIKQLTGKDTITGRFMRQDWFSFTPTHTLWLLANHQPNVRAGGPAFWRRVRMLPFEHTVPKEKRIPDLEDRLVNEEGPAILAWLIQGAADYFNHGLAEPASVSAATDAYAADQDTVARFVEERCETGAANAQHLHVRTTTLRAAYENWCKAEGETPVSAKTLTQQLKARYDIQTSRSASSRFYDGIRLIDMSPNTDDPAEPSHLEDQGW